MDKKEDLKRFRQDQQQLEIFTLGRFLVRRGDRLLSESAIRSVKVWTLFKYLLTYRGKALFPANILESLWPDQQYKDPNQQMRFLAYRLRRLLADEPADPHPASNVVFAQGCYRWSENGPYWLDVDEFEETAVAAASLHKENPAAAIEMLKKAAKLYMGVYLPECSGDEWVLAARNHYHRLYLKSALLLADLLRKEGCFDEVVQFCRSALEIEYFEEKLHLHYLEALLEEGNSLEARIHYEEATAAFYREMGVKPSSAMRLLYSRIQFAGEGGFTLNLSQLQKQLETKQDSGGVFVCDPELFQYFYRLETKRLERAGGGSCLGLLALTTPDYCKLLRDILQKAMECLLEILQSSLRKGDLICRTHEAQILLLLTGLKLADAGKVLSRIDDEFRGNYTLPELFLHKKTIQITAEKHCPLPSTGD